jgi:ApaG protein
MSSPAHAAPAPPPPSRLGSEAVTHGIRITVTPQYLPDQSDAARPQHVFGYAVRITNEGDAPVTLLSRRWRIVDANGNEEEVVGEGVVGVQPRMNAGESFGYSSYCHLRTRWGTMEGEYTLRRDDGRRLAARIARFFLAVESAPAGATA